MTLKQTRDFILEELKFRAPTLFSDEALAWIRQRGYVAEDGRVIEYHGQVYKLIKRDHYRQIVVTRKTKRLKVPCTCGVCNCVKLLHRHFSTE